MTVVGQAVEMTIFCGGKYKTTWWCVCVGGIHWMDAPPKKTILRGNPL